MKLRITASLSCLFLPLWVAIAGIPPEEPSIALFSKVILDVSKKELDKDWQKAKRGETLGSGDRVKTGERSVAIIKFKDNSLVRIRERSELTVTATQKNSAFSKSVDLENGVIGFSVKKQRADEEFRFSSPTSVASVRGTGGMFATAAGADTLTVIEGMVILMNKSSGNSVNVQAGYTGVSRQDGTIATRRATAEEQRAAEEAVKSSEPQNRLEFELRDGQGKAKKLQIEFKD